jgi:hypothetical protein
MNEIEDIKNAIRTVAAIDENWSVVCTVSEVDLAERTCSCTPVNGDAVLTGVRLNADNKKGFTLIPTSGSKVVVTMINKSTGYVAMVSEVSEVHLNGTNYNGLVKVDVLKTQLNTLQTEINTLKTAITALMAGYAPIDSGVALTAFNAVTLPQINLTTIENTTIKQGNGG